MLVGQRSRYAAPGAEFFAIGPAEAGRRVRSRFIPDCAASAGAGAGLEAVSNECAVTHTLEPLVTMLTRQDGRGHEKLSCHMTADPIIYAPRAPLCLPSIRS